MNRLWRFSCISYTFYVFGPFDTAEAARAELNKQYDGLTNQTLDADEITEPHCMIEDF